MRQADRWAALWRQPLLLGLAGLLVMWGCTVRDLHDPAARARAQEVVSMIASGQLKVSGLEHGELVSLPDDYKDLSATGQVGVTREDFLVVLFYVSQTPLGPNRTPAFVYVSDGDLRLGDPSLWTVEQLDRNWFYVDEVHR